MPENIGYIDVKKSIVVIVVSKAEAEDAFWQELLIARSVMELTH